MRAPIQLELPTPPPALPVPAATETAWLEQMLLDAKRWMTAQDIIQATHGRLRDRDIRQLASETANLISGQRGYLHVAHATTEEIEHAANWLTSQGRKMIQRALAISRRARQLKS